MVDPSLQVGPGNGVGENSNLNGRACSPAGKLFQLNISQRTWGVGQSAKSEPGGDKWITGVISHRPKLVSMVGRQGLVRVTKHLYGHQTNKSWRQTG